MSSSVYNERSLITSPQSLYTKENATIIPKCFRSGLFYYSTETKW